MKCPNCGETVVFEEGITAIPDYALDSCTGLKNVTIPSSVEYISNGAFYGCEALENVYASDLESWIGIDFYYDSFQCFCCSETLTDPRTASR